MQPWQILRMLLLPCSPRLTPLHEAVIERVASGCSNTLVHWRSHGAAVALLAAENLLKLIAKKPQTETIMTSEEPRRRATSVARHASRVPTSRRLRIAEQLSHYRLVVTPAVLLCVAVVHHRSAIEDSNRVFGSCQLLLHVLMHPRRLDQYKKEGAAPERRHPTPHSPEARRPTPRLVLRTFLS